MKPRLGKLQSTKGEDATRALASLSETPTAKSKAVQIAQAVALRITNRDHEQVAKLIK